MRDEDYDTTGVNLEKDWEELEQLKKAYEEIETKKGQIDELVERQQLALEEQERILEDVMQKDRAEHDGMEKVAGEFANKMKTYTHFKEETTNMRLHHKEVEIQAEILNGENEELAQDLSELVIHINEIEEHRHIGLKRLKEKTEEMICVAQQTKYDDDRLESDIKKKVEDLSNLRMELNDRGIPYVSESKSVQVNAIKAEKPFSLIENPLKINIECLDEPLPTTDTARYEKSPKKVLEKVTITSNKEVRKQFIGKADYSHRLNEGDEMMLSNDKGSEEVEDMNKDVDDFEKKALEMKHRIEGSGGEMEICYHKRSEKVQDLNKDADDFGKKAFEMKLGIDTEKGSKEMLKPIKQLSALELVRLPGKRDKKTNIPKPMLHPYGSALRDGDRHAVFNKSPSVLVLRKDYDRNRYVPENQRNAFEAVVGYFSAEIENQPPIKYQSPFSHKTETIRSPAEIEQHDTLTKNNTGTLNILRNGEIKSLINRGRQNIKRCAKDNNQSLKKSSKTKHQEIVTQPFSRKSEIKPKFDTRLNAVKHKQANPVRKKPKLPNLNKSKSDNYVQKDSTDSVKQVKHARSKTDMPTKPSVSRREPKPKQLPHLKMIKEETDKGKTVENSSARKQVEHKLTSMSINIPDKQERAKCSLPPIGRSPTTRHGSANKVMESDHLTSLSGISDSFLLQSVSPTKRLSPPIATSPAEQKLHPEPEVNPLHRKPVLSKSNELAQQREPAVTWPLFSPSPPQSPPPKSRRSRKLENMPIVANSPTVFPSPPQSPPPSSRRSRKLGNMPILADSPTIDSDRKPHLRA